MKSFKQKQEEKSKRLDAERLIAEEKALKIAQQKESERIEQERLDEIAYNKALLEEQQRQEDNIWEDRQAKKLLEQQEVEYLKSLELDNQIDNYRASKEKELESRSSQKDTIKEILSGEDQIRENILSAERQIEIDAYEDHQLQKIEEAEKLLEQELAEERYKQKQKNLKEIAEQEKLARWKENEKVEQEEKQRMKELRESQEKEMKARKAAELQEIISSRKIYELRQKEIAKEQKENRDAVNEILQEAQYILDSEKASREKDILTNLNDYIYKLNPKQEKNIWTERKQPKSILTWEDWKQVPANNILIEQDFKRARLLFEQDNQRAQRYHDHMYQNFAARNLTLDRKKAITAAGKLVDIPRSDAINIRREIVEEIGDISVWLDAADQGLIDATVTASMATASISSFWVPDALIGVNDVDVHDTETFNSSSLVVENADNLFDGNPNTFMTIRHTSASYDWDQRNQDVADKKESLKGIIYVRIKAPAIHTDKRIERIELTSTDRNFIPTYVSSWMRSQGATKYSRVKSFNITASVLNNYNNRFGGSENSSPPMGGPHGITAEGSASLDPYLVNGLYPTQKITTDASDPGVYELEDNGYENNFLVRINSAATGSEVRFNRLDIWYHDTSGSVTNDTAVHQIKARPGPHINTSASLWRRVGDTDINSRHTVAESPIWYSGSANQPNGINMPYIQFRSESFGALTSLNEFGDYTKNKGFTQFWVARDTSGPKNFNGIWFGDSGQTFKEAQKIGVSGFYKGIYFVLTDWSDGGDMTSANQRHQGYITKDVNHLELDLYGNGGHHATGSPWPYSGLDANFIGRNQIESSILNREVSITCHQLDNPMTEVSSSRYRLWHKGGTPFVDLDASPITDYVTTGSHKARPQLGADGQESYWADFRLHEMMIFNKVLTTNEIDTVNDYLSDKWQLITNPVTSDKNGQFVYGFSSSISSMDQVTYDGSNVLSSADNIYSSSGWELH